MFRIPDPERACCQVAGLDRAAQIVNEIASSTKDFHCAHADSEYAAGYNRALADACRLIKAESAKVGQQ